jgi:BMFP domain-containing protein YqiC
LQTQVLAKTRAKLEELEAKVSALEKKWLPICLPSDASAALGNIKTK